MRRIFTGGLLLLALGAWSPLWAAEVATPTHVVVIGHPDLSLDTLTRDELLDYFAGDRQQWPDGTRVVIKELKRKGPVRDAFYQFLGQRPSRMKSIWLRRLLSGEGERPESLATEQEMLERVSTTPGAIGFVSKQVANEAVKSLILISVADE